MKRLMTYGYLLLLMTCIVIDAYAQERVAPMNYNPVLKDGYKGTNALRKATALSLPFFEDFTGYDVYPDANKWVEHQVYVNNTMCVSPVSRGVATFDALNDRGLPYDTTNNGTLLNADSLTSLPIDISGLQASDSIYISFFYQPGGNGFYPRTADSLMLFFKRDNGVWDNVWTIPGTTPQPFAQAMVAVTGANYFHAAFQFRFVNKASINTSDCVWNLDYIRVATGRNMNDTAVNDVAFATDPASILNDYTSMPYRQFLANSGAELATQQHDSIRNNYSFAQTVNASYIAREKVSGSLLFTSPVSSSAIAAGTTQDFSYNTYTPSFPSPGLYSRVVFENKFFFPQVSGSEPHDNDTIVGNQVFDNYLAYDDGTAEKSYYLNLFSTLPGKLAIEHHLNQPDTLRGIAIYFGRQVPGGSNKLFSATVYKDLQGINGAPSDNVLYQEDLLQPAYGNINQYWVYRFQTPVVLPAGTFYIGTVQPAFSGSDSLYFGLDVNRVTGNHAYYNVLSSWVGSTISGAIMIRPLLGQEVFNTGIDIAGQQAVQESINVYPNPTTDQVYLDHNGYKELRYQLADVQGRVVMSGVPDGNKSIQVSTLSPGIYILRTWLDGVAATPQKIIKQ